MSVKAKASVYELVSVVHFMPILDTRFAWSRCLRGLPRFRGHVIECCTLSVRPSRVCLRFSRNRNVIETYNLVETQRSYKV